jgi:hypothetical protein
MNDIFYFTEQNVGLKEIQDELQLSTSYEYFLTEKQDALQVTLGSNERLQFDLLELPVDIVDPGDLEVLQKSAVKSAICISHHSYSLDKVKSILHILLKRFGGWIGNDSDAFEPRFSIDNLNEFTYPK